MSEPTQSDGPMRAAIEVVIRGEVVTPEGDSMGVRVALVAEEDDQGRPILDFRLIEPAGPDERTVLGHNLIVDERVLVRAIEVLREERGLPDASGE